jgi:hypothetical protein
VGLLRLGFRGGELWGRGSLGWIRFFGRVLAVKPFGGFKELLIDDRKLSLLAGR